MSVTSGFFNSLNGDRRYNAEQMSAIFDGIINDGVFASIGSVFAVTVNTGNDILVGTGRAWFNSTWLYNDTILPLTADVSEILLNRYDAVVIEINHSESVRSGLIKIVNGTPATEPLLPTMVDTAEVHQYPLAYIYRPAGSSSITQANITNVVGTSSCPYITGVLEVHNIDNIVAQWSAQWDEWCDEQNESALQMKSEWTKWFEDLSTEMEQWTVNKQTEWTKWFNDMSHEMDSWNEEKRIEFLNWFDGIRDTLSGDVAASLAARIEDIENGTTTVGNSRTVNGFHVYASLNDIGCTTDSMLSDVYSAMSYPALLLLNGTEMTDPSWNLPINNATITIVKQSGTRGYLEIQHRTDGTTYRMGITDDATPVPDGEWHQVAYMNDVLPLTGGTLSRDSFSPLVLNNSNDSSSGVGLDYKLRGTKLGSLGFSGTNEPAFFDTSGVKKDLHHSGNSRKVASATNVSVATSYWESDTTYADYPYKADILFDEATENDIPYITFALENMGIFAPVASTGIGVVTIYASEKPTAEITIPSIVLIKGV